MPRGPERAPLSRAAPAFVESGAEHDGDRATPRAFWVEFKMTRRRKPYLGEGQYQANCDASRRWLFRQRDFNEQREKMARGSQSVGSKRKVVSTVRARTDRFFRPDEVHGLLEMILGAAGGVLSRGLRSARRLQAYLEAESMLLG